MEALVLYLRLGKQGQAQPRLIKAKQSATLTRQQRKKVSRPLPPLHLHSPIHPSPYYYHTSHFSAAVRASGLCFILSLLLLFVHCWNVHLLTFLPPLYCYSPLSSFTLSSHLLLSILISYTSTFTLFAFYSLCYIVKLHSTLYFHCIPYLDQSHVFQRTPHLV